MDYIISIVIAFGLGFLIGRYFEELRQFINLIVEKEKMKGGKKK